MKNETGTNNIKRKLKFGSLSVTFMVVFIALVLVINLFISTIKTKVSTTIDLTKEGYFEISEASDAALAAAPSDYKVTIYFLAARDIFASASDYRIVMIHGLAEEYARRYSDHVTIEYKDINKDVSFVEKYLSETQTQLTTSHIIIQGNYYSRILTLDAFFLTDEDDGSYYAFQGELRYTSSILQVSFETQPKALFTKGHGETVKGTLVDDEGNYGETDYDVALLENPSMKNSLINASPLMSILSVGGFDISTVDLTKENIPSEARIVVISNPKNDFTSYDPQNPNERTEVNKLTEHVNGYKSLYVVVGAETPDLPNLNEFLWENYGMKFEAGYKICDVEQCVNAGSTNAFDGYSVIGKYVGTESTVAHELHKMILSSSVKTVFRDAVKLTLKSDVSTTKASLTTYPTAQVMYEGKSVETGSFPLFAAFTQLQFGENNVMMYKHVMLCSSASFASPTFTNAVYGNRKILQSMTRIMSTSLVVPDDIEYKVLPNEGLDSEKLTAEKAKNLMWLVSAVIPLAIFAAGGIVWFRRRHL